MENLENMEKIEAAQTELCQFLVSMMPVPWEKIYFYDESEINHNMYWFAVAEKETGVICRRETFWKRYDSLPYKEMDTISKLGDLMKNLYNAYLERFGADHIWCMYYLTIDNDLSFHVDLGYEMPEGNRLDRRNAVYQRFFGGWEKDVEGKYPATE
jgi:hypothetical protein